MSKILVIFLGLFIAFLLLIYFSRKGKGISPGASSIQTPAKRLVQESSEEVSVARKKKEIEKARSTFSWVSYHAPWLTSKQSGAKEASPHLAFLPKEKIRYRNHQALNQALNHLEDSFYLYRKHKTIVPLRKALEEGALALYNDLLLAPDLRAKADAQSSLSFQDKNLATDLNSIQLPPNLFAYEVVLNKSYINQLGILLTSVKNLDQKKTSDEHIIGFAVEARELLASRKDYSDGYYMRRIKEYFLGPEHSFTDKMEYMQSFVEAKDISLMQYASGYFKNLLDQKASLADNEKKQITDVLQTIQDIRSKE